MLKQISIAVALVGLGLSCAVWAQQNTPAAPMAPFKRTILQKFDVPGTNYETVTVLAESDRPLRTGYAVASRFGGAGLSYQGFGLGSEMPSRGQSILSVDTFINLKTFLSIRHAASAGSSL